MRSLRLARVAVEAEISRLRHHVHRTVFRVVMGLLAMALLLIAVVFLHLGAWYWLTQSWPPYLAALIFAGIDLALAALLAVLVVRSSPGRAEREALAVRRRALDDAADSLSVWALLSRLMGLLMTSRPRS